MSINYIDLFVLLIVIVSIVFGFKKGFLKTITGLLSIVLSLVLAMTLYPHAAKIIENTFVYDVVYEKTAEFISVPDNQADNVSNFSLGSLNLPRNLTAYMQQKAEETTRSFAVTISDTVATLAVKIVSMLLVFVVARLLIYLITKFAGVIKKLPVIGFGDSLLGALFGLFRGMIIVYILLAVVTFLTSMSPQGTASKMIKSSEFAKVMYHDNVLLDFAYKN